MKIARLVLLGIAVAAPSKQPTIRARDGSSTGRVNLVRFGVTATTIPK
jgi:hypothetical protein